MDKLKMQSMVIAQGNVAKIAALFPQCVTERIGKDGTAELAIDFVYNDDFAQGKEDFELRSGLFDEEDDQTTIEEMAKLLPTHLVIRDSSAANDNVLDNFDQIIESYSAEKKITTHIL